MSARCDKCQNQRWLTVIARWVEDRLASEVRPFGRDGWNAYGALSISTALASKALYACPECNPERRPPWSKSWSTSSSAPATDDPTPF
jgi:hypothetical protein